MMNAGTGLWLTLGVLAMIAALNAGYYVKRLRFDAFHDVLTRLPNRRRFMQDLEREIDRGAGAFGAVLLVNINRFGSITETLGYGTGDAVLAVAACRIKEAVERSDDLAPAAAVYRFEGSRFAILMRSLPSQSPRRPVALANRLLGAFAAPLAAGNTELYLDVTVGLAQYPGDASEAAEVLRHADSALQQLKREGGSGLLRYSDELAAPAAERLKLEAGLRRALERDELFLLYQPQIDIAGNRVTGVEALVRWRHPELGVIPPAKFIPIAEETGLIVEIGAWILQAACLQQQRWRAAGLALGIAVNVSARQLLDAAFPQVIEQSFACRESPAQLEIEITETAAMRDVEHTVRLLAAVKGMNVRVAIDDFGTGYSSLNYLKRFAVDKLKIDRAFVRTMIRDPDDAAIVQAIIALAHRMGVAVVAEGVETGEQLRALWDYGCDHAQGFLIARPLPAGEVTALAHHRPFRYGSPALIKTAVPPAATGRLPLEAPAT